MSGRTTAAPHGSLRPLLGAEGLFFLVIGVQGLASPQTTAWPRLGALASLYIAVLFALWSLARPIGPKARLAQAMISTSYLVQAAAMAAASETHGEFGVASGFLRIAAALILMLSWVKARAKA